MRAIAFVVCCIVYVAIGKGKGKGKHGRSYTKGAVREGDRWIDQ